MVVCGLCGMHLVFCGSKRKCFAVSVSESMVDRVRNYIKNQEEHHQKKTFQDEYNELIEKYEFQK